MIQAGNYYDLKAIKEVDFGFYLDADGQEILLPRRFVPHGLAPGDVVRVFIYHDNEDRLIATTQRPYATVGEIAALRCVSTTKIGAFLKWGIMKDVFVPLSQQISRMHEGQSYLVYLFIDGQTGRVTGTEKFQKMLSNETLTVQQQDKVDLVVWQQTDIGYKVIVNNRHTGVVHFNEVFRDLSYGEKLTGFVKSILDENKLNIGIGEKGYAKVSPESERLLTLLRANDGYLPYNDKSSPEDIYTFFGVSKKTFKMTVGALYKQRKIEITKTGIKLIN